MPQGSLTLGVYGLALTFYQFISVTHRGRGIRIDGKNGAFGSAVFQEKKKKVNIMKVLILIFIFKNLDQEQMNF